MLIPNNGFEKSHSVGAQVFSTLKMKKTFQNNSLQSQGIEKKAWIKILLRILQAKMMI